MLSNVSLCDEASVRPSSPVDDWSLFRGAHPAALLIGSAASVDAALVRLLPDLRPPLVHWRPWAVGELPQTTTGTLVMWDVESLSKGQQAQLLVWMENRPAVQVISISECPLFPLVRQKEFLDSLYYRLNVVCVELSASLDSALDADSPPDT
jgi:Sigma-54 interaction domain